MSNFESASEKFEGIVFIDKNRNSVIEKIEEA